MKHPSVIQTQLRLKPAAYLWYDRKRIGKRAQQSMHMEHMHISIIFITIVCNFFMVASPFLQNVLGTRTLYHRCFNLSIEYHNESSS